MRPIFFLTFFLSTHTATTEIYTLSLHDALPIYHNSYKTKNANKASAQNGWVLVDAKDQVLGRVASQIAKVIRGKHKTDFTDRKSTRLNSSHVEISYAVFCLKKKKKKKTDTICYK